MWRAPVASAAAVVVDLVAAAAAVVDLVAAVGLRQAVAGEAVDLAVGLRQEAEAVFPETGRRRAGASHPAQAVRAVHRPSLEAKAARARPPARQGQRNAAKTEPIPGFRDSKSGPSGRASAKKA
jgi:hypothetical protein